MAAPNVDLDKPDFANDADSDIDALRDNLIWTVIAFAVEGINFPSWNAVPSGTDLSKPDAVVLTGPGSRKIRMTYSYTGDNVTGIDVDYDKNLGAGYEQVTLGTATLTYNGSGNWTGTTWV